MLTLLSAKLCGGSRAPSWVVVVLFCFLLLHWEHAQHLQIWCYSRFGIHSLVMALIKRLDYLIPMLRFK